ncbi:hypothetical protein JCM10213_005926 [Rhodosporidiobolus nylandii]
MSTDELVAQFTSLTGAPASQASFFLDSAGGDLDTAVAYFFDQQGGGGAGGGGDDASSGDVDLPGAFSGRAGPPPVAAASSPAPAAQASGAYTLDGRPAEPLPQGWGSSAGPSAPRVSNPIRSNAGPRVTGFRDLASSGPSFGGGSSGGSSSKFGSFSQLKKREEGGGGFGGFGGGGGGGGDDSDDEGRDPTNFYTGGAKSGLSVENPDDARRRAAAAAAADAGGPGGGVGDMVRSLLQQAREGSQRHAEREEQAQAGRGAGWFGGSAHTLGDDETPSQYIPDPSARPSASSPQDSEEEEEDEKLETAIRHLTFWQEGFSIDDGDLMRYEENQELLAAIQAGRAPLAVLRVAWNQPVELRISDRKSEKWTRQPAAPVGKWGGAGGGNRLGSASPFPEPAASAATPAAGGSASVGAAGETQGSSAGGQTVFEVDRNEPMTQVQVRLRNGERMVATFNLTHTIGDIRRYINASSPANNASAYVLQTTFPSRDLTDEAQTIKDAGVAGSVVVQRGV